MNALLYAMDGDTEDIMASFTFTKASDTDKYHAVKAKFDNYFIAKRNLIYEGARFNQHVQGQDEPVDNFMSDLYRLAEFCAYE